MPYPAVRAGEEGVAGGLGGVGKPPPVRAGEEGVFFRDVLRMYDKRSTALKTDTPFPGTGVTIEAYEALETLVGR